VYLIFEFILYMIFFEAGAILQALLILIQFASLVSFNSKNSNRKMRRGLNCDEEKRCCCDEEERISHFYPKQNPYKTYIFTYGEERMLL
jgi:hypothetical protein